MNEIKVKVNFKNRTIYKQGVDLTSGDYNSTKLLFEFDRQDGRKVFEMKDPDGNLVLLADIENNEVELVGKDENGNNVSLFNKPNDYRFEISLYDGDSKLTSASDYIKVKQEQVIVDGEPITAYLPIFDKLINEVENLNIEMENGIVIITRKDGSQHSENVNGEDYIITEEDYEEIETNVKSDIQPILENIENVANESNAIARGKAQTKTFKTFVELEEWLRDVSNKGILKQGDNLYIEALYTDETETTKQPDYWVTETLEEPNEEGYYYNISTLGAETPVLIDYAKKEQFVTLLNEKEYEDLSTNGTVNREDGKTLVFNANTYYFIPEEE